MNDTIRTLLEECKPILQSIYDGRGPFTDDEKKRLEDIQTQISTIAQEQKTTLDSRLFVTLLDIAGYFQLIRLGKYSWLEARQHIDQINKLLAP